MNDELFWIGATIIAVIGIVIYIIVSDIAHFLGAGVSVTAWALFTTFVVLPFIVIILKKFLGDIKNKFFIFLSLPILWYNWGQVLLSHAKKSSVFGSIPGMSYSNSFSNTLPWWGTSWFFWVTEIIFIIIFIIYIILDHLNS